VAARRFLTIRYDLRAEDDPLAALLTAIERHDVSSAVVRVIVQIRADQESLLRDADIRQALQEAYYVAGIGKEVERVYRQRLGGDSPEGLSSADLLTRYLESTDTSPERIELLLQYAQEIFQAEG
jgi:exonuclease SbcD